MSNTGQQGASRPRQLSIQEQILEQMDEQAQRRAVADADHTEGERTPRQTPFGMLLQDWLAAKRPAPWSPGRLATELTRRLGYPVRRYTTYNWIRQGMNPPIETILTVLAALNIPLSDLIAAYRAAGVRVPDLMGPDAAAAASAVSSTAAEAAEAAARAAQRRANEWEEMIAHTRQSMALAGFPEGMIEATITMIEAKRDNTDPMERHIRAEHDPRDTHVTPLTQLSRYDYDEAQRYGPPAGAPNTDDTGRGGGGATSGSGPLNGEPRERHGSNPKNR
jgi:hypothetical protein